MPEEGDSPEFAAISAALSSAWSSPSPASRPPLQDLTTISIRSTPLEDIAFRASAGSSSLSLSSPAPFDLTGPHFIISPVQVKRLELAGVVYRHSTQYSVEPFVCSLPSVDVLSLHGKVVNPVVVHLCSPNMLPSLREIEVRKANFSSSAEGKTLFERFISFLRRRKGKIKAVKIEGCKGLTRVDLEKFRRVVDGKVEWDGQEEDWETDYNTTDSEEEFSDSQW
ncbi:hypothetical protein CC2G_008607 [Coprinopsis cinerea AmutBmut pab1-1]|nr:hypothetical protein CC2G_008607 [Coprinopsis cinerea AmutBmut pab1-1]